MKRLLFALLFPLPFSLHAAEVAAPQPTYNISHSLVDQLKATAGDGDQLVLNGQKFTSGIEKDGGELSQYLCQRRSVSKNSLMGPNQFCSLWPDFESKIKSMAQATGFPAPVMQCTYLIESKFQPGLTSPVGAKGLSQFMPATASDLASAVKRKPELSNMWLDYKKSQCTLKSKDCMSSKLTKDSILGANDDIDAQLMATPLFYREYYSQFESDWANLIDKDPSKKNDYYHFLVIGYNAGPKRAERFLRNLKNGVKPPDKFLPKETLNYVNQLDDCMFDRGPAIDTPAAKRTECDNLGRGRQCEQPAS